jgi:hypothetical protein
MLCGCEDEAGEPAGDYVVKLRGSMERGDAGGLCELGGSLLAREFGLSVPEPALVVIESDFADQVAAVAPARAAEMKKSIGLNFGCLLLTDAMGWPVDKFIPEAMWQTAVNTFAFDALIQNPDRRFSNQNLLTRGDDIFVFDHELAFSFLLDILPSAEPWKLEGQAYLADHVFYRKLRGKPIDLGAFVQCLTRLPKKLTRIVKAVPSKWNNGELDRIERHLRTVAHHAEEFAEQIRRKLL